MENAQSEYISRNVTPIWQFVQIAPPIDIVNPFEASLQS